MYNIIACSWGLIVLLNKKTYNFVTSILFKFFVYIVLKRKKKSIETIKPIGKVTPKIYLKYIYSLLGNAETIAY